MDNLKADQPEAAELMGDLPLEVLDAIAECLAEAIAAVIQQAARNGNAEQSESNKHEHDLDFSAESR
jgi:hypothetical protein